MYLPIYKTTWIVISVFRKKYSCLYVYLQLRLFFLFFSRPSNERIQSASMTTRAKSEPGNGPRRPVTGGPTHTADRAQKRRRYEGTFQTYASHLQTSDTNLCTLDFQGSESPFEANAVIHVVMRDVTFEQ